MEPTTETTTPEKTTEATAPVEKTTPEPDYAAQIAALQAQAAENLNLAKYQKAEFENYKRRTQDAVSKAFQDGQTAVITMLLPIFDGVVEAEKKIANPVDLEGFKIIRNKLNDLFTKLGIEEIPTKDQDFDPKLHNAAAVEKVDGVAADKILEEWQKGFLFHGHVLRPAMVKVSGS